MIKHATTSGNHYGVGYTGQKVTPTDSQVLVQVMEAGNQARIALTPEQARHMAGELIQFASRAQAANQLAVILTEDIGLLNACTDLMCLGRKVDAIKLYRERMQSSLLEAKRAIEYLFEEVSPVASAPTPPAA